MIQGWFDMILSSGSYVYSNEYKAMLDYADANGIRKPELLVDRIAEDTLVRALVSTGVFAKADQAFLIGTAGSREFGYINMKNPGTRNGTIQNTYVDTNFAPSSHGVNYTQNSAGIIVRCGYNAVALTGLNDYGGGNGTNGITAINFKNSANNTQVWVNQSTSGLLANTTTKANYVISRSASNVVKVYKAGSQLGSNLTGASNGLTTANIVLNSYNDSGAKSAPSVRKLEFWLIGAALDSDVSAIETLLNAFFNSTIASITQNSFTDTTSITNFISDINSSTVTSYPTPQETLISVGTLGSLTYQGAAHHNGYVYFSPSAATSIMKVNSADDSFSTFGSIGASTFKYQGVIKSTVNGKLYFCPGTANAVMKVDPSTDTITYFDTSGSVASSSAGNLGAGNQKWYGINEGQDGKLYCLPYNGTAVLIIDPSTDTIQFCDSSGIVAGPSGNLGAGGKWDSAISYGRYIYGSPSDATTLLKVDTQNHITTTVTGFPSGTAKWALSCVGPNNYLYIFPYFDNRIIKFNPANDTWSYLSTTIGSIDGNIKVGACQLMPDRKILVLCYNHSNHYILDPSNDSLLAIKKLNTLCGSIGGALTSNGKYYSAPISASGSNTFSIIKFEYPRRSISLSTNFIDNRHIRSN